MQKVSSRAGGSGASALEWARFDVAVRAGSSRTCCATGNFPGRPFVAHEFGGAVALRAHLLHGVAYTRLALVDPVSLAPRGTSFFRLVRRAVAR